MSRLPQMIFSHDFQQVVHLQFSSVQSLSRVWLFATPWIPAHQASLSITNSQSSLKLMSIESVMPSSHLILYRPLLLLPPIPPSIWVFSNESTLRMRWPKYWSFSFSISPSKEHPGLIPFQCLFPGDSAGKESACNAGDLSSHPGSGRSTAEGIGYPLQNSWASLVAQLVKNLPAMWET